MRLLVGLDNEMIETELLKGLGVGEELMDCCVGDEVTGLWNCLGVGGGLMGFWIDRGVRGEVTGLGIAPKFGEQTMELGIELGGGEEGTELIWMVLGGGEVTRGLRGLLWVHTVLGDLSVLLRRWDRLGVQGVGLQGLLHCGATGDSSLTWG